MLPSRRAAFPAKGCFSTKQDVQFVMIIATRSDKLGKELVASVHDLGEHRKQTQMPPETRVVIWGLVSMSRIGVAKSFVWVAQDARQHRPAYVFCLRHW